MTDKQFATKLTEMVIIVDSREQQAEHITNYFDKRDIKWVSRKLNYGDYSFEINGQSFETKIAIERKNSLDELSGNIAQGRERFERELECAKVDNSKLILMVENGSYEKILNRKYRTDLNERSYIASLFSFKARYNIELEFIESKMSGWFIGQTFKYFLREQIKMGD